MKTKHWIILAMGALMTLCLGVAVDVEARAGASTAQPERYRLSAPLHPHQEVWDNLISASAPITGPTITPSNTFTVTPTPTVTITPTSTDTPTTLSSPMPTLTHTPCPMNFNDVRPTDYFYEPVRYLYCHGAISGYSDGTFRPSNKVIVGQALKLMVLAFGIPIYVPPGPSFCGVPSTDPFYIYLTSYYYYVGPIWSCENFNIYRFMTRGQWVKSLLSTTCWPIDLTGAPHFTDVQPVDYFYTSVETAYNRGLIGGYADGTFRPYNTITRGQGSKMMHRAALQGLQCPPRPTPTYPVPTMALSDKSGYASSKAQDFDIQASAPLTTPTLGPTRTLTPTITTTPQPCDPHGSLHDLVVSCTPPNSYDYSFLVNMQPCQSAVGGGIAMLQASANQGGPWTELERQSFSRTFYNGENAISGTITIPSMPPQYQWYRIDIFGYVGQNFHKFYGTSVPAPVCGGPTFTPTNTSTPTVTDTPSSPTNTPTRTYSPTFTVTVTPCPMDFDDVQPTDYFYTSIRYLYCAGAITGYEDNTFRPYNNTTRGQIRKVVLIAFHIPISFPVPQHFSDVPPTHPFFIYIETLYKRGVLSGYADGTFRPQNNVTRGQAVKIILRADFRPPIDPPIPTYNDVPRTNPFYGYVEAAACGGVVTGYSDGTFRPGNNVTRAQTCKIIYMVITGGPACLATPTPVPTARVRNH